MRHFLKQIRGKDESPLNGKRTIDFLICGTQKGGTSALDEYLREHPDICMADRKEVHFFDNESNFANGQQNYANYHSHFKPEKRHKLLGEATPIYMYWNDAPKRIWEYNPDIKIIILLRNPIERAHSHWNMEHSRNADTDSFWNAITNEEARCREALPLQHRVYSYVDRGFYRQQLRRLWAFFPRDRVLVLKNEDLKQQPQFILSQVCDFLGVNPFKSILARDVHSRPYKSTMSERERDYLRSVFEYEIKGLERELNWDCSDWLSD